MGNCIGGSSRAPAPAQPVALQRADSLSEVAAASRKLKTAATSVQRRNPALEGLPRMQRNAEALLAQAQARIQISGSGGDIEGMVRETGTSNHELAQAMNQLADNWLRA